MNKFTAFFRVKNADAILKECKLRPSRFIDHVEFIPHESFKYKNSVKSKPGVAITPAQRNARCDSSKDNE
jgi:hypothetical protein